MKIYLTGAVSLLGKYLLSVLSSHHELFASFYTHAPEEPLQKLATWQQLDLTDPEVINEALQKIKPEVIIHLAGLSDIEYCQSHPDTSQRVNVESTGYLVAAANELSSHLIFSSSSMVFSGENPPYSETDNPDPITIYGKHKYAAEKIAASAKKYTIVRFSTLYGWPPAGARANDLPLYLEQLKKNQPLYLVNDRFFNPISAHVAAELITHIVEKPKFGIFHLGGTESISRYELVGEITRVFKIKNPPQLIPVPSTHFKSLAPRPKNNTLATQKIEKEYGIKLAPLTTYLEEFKREE